MRRVFLGGILVAALTAAAWAGLSRTGAAPPVPAVRPAEPGAQPNAFYAEELFLKGLKEAREAPGPRSPGRLVGGVVPHHILAGAMLSRLFLQLEEHPPATVIVVGPNHPNRGQKVITGRRGWSTDFGTVAADTDLEARLVKAGLATEDDDTLSAEHSVGALMPYIKFHVPKARVVPIILHHDVGPAEARTLADALAPLLGPDCVLIASVDFSHYLTRPEAEAKDVQTLAAIRSGDLEALRRMESDHLDSPAAIFVVMMAMQKLGAGGPELIAHTNSGVILGSDSIETTSYFTFAFRLPAVR